MRSFAGVLLHTCLGGESILLIDEPEAFLHPPQARQLARTLVSEKPNGRQIFIATHSGDILRGILNSDHSNVRIVRIQRSGNVNTARELDNSQINQVWSDSLLRYSNILDGIFHELVVVGESDSDCRFYAAILDSLFRAENPNDRQPDVMFTHCGGKARLALVVRALRHLGVPTVCITDFDVLNSEHPLCDIVESFGGTWSDFKADWKLVKNSIDQKKPELNTEEITRDIKTVLDGISEPVFPPLAKQRIQSILRRSSPWTAAKEVGKAFVPKGDPTQACDRLLKQLRAIGIFVVEVGELEGFARSVGNHGPAWVNEVLKRDIGTDPEFGPARDFVTAMIPVPLQI
jgi:hypothetical protein